jgi:hypothetical protein
MYQVRSVLTAEKIHSLWRTGRALSTDQGRLSRRVKARPEVRSTGASQDATYLKEAADKHREERATERGGGDGRRLFFIFLLLTEGKLM